jgi:hypothetical protein
LLLSARIIFVDNAAAVPYVPKSSPKPKSIWRCEKFAMGLKRLLSRDTSERLVAAEAEVANGAGYYRFNVRDRIRGRREGPAELSNAIF